MTFAWIRRAFCLSGLALGLAAAYACSLNPQPLPPGDTPDGATNAPTVGSDASAFGGDDSGGSLTADGPAAGGQPDATSDGGVASPPEGGDAGDAGDGSVDGPTDAAEDAPGDAPTDGEEAGG
jgi:hypothetical protein